MRAKLSTKRCVGAFAPCASSTAWMIRASVVLLATAVTRYSNEPASLIVPAYTGSPSPFSTGRLSPVIGAWLTVERPATISPSRPIRSPGFTRTTAPSATCAASTVCHEPSGCLTVAVSGASRIRLWIALRARSSERASISSATVKSTITIAASGHWPIAIAPVTAMLISALMFRLPFVSAIQPLRYVPRPQVATAASASAAASHTGSCSHVTASDAAAATPAIASGHHGRGASAGMDGAPRPVAPVSARSGVIPSERIAPTMPASAPGACSTVSIRCIRLNSSAATSAIPPSFLRISVSSVGQSICMIRNAERTRPSAAFCAPGSGANATGAGAQQAAPEWAWACG